MPSPARAEPSPGKANARITPGAADCQKNLFRGSMKVPQPLHVQSAAGGVYGGEGRIPPLLHNNAVRSD